MNLNAEHRTFFGFNNQIIFLSIIQCEFVIIVIYLFSIFFCFITRDGCRNSILKQIFQANPCPDFKIDQDIKVDCLVYRFSTNITICSHSIFSRTRWNKCMISFVCLKHFKEFRINDLIHIYFFIVSNINTD